MAWIRGGCRHKNSSNKLTLKWLRPFGLELVTNGCMYVFRFDTFITTRERFGRDSKEITNEFQEVHIRAGKEYSHGLEYCVCTYVCARVCV